MGTKIDFDNFLRQKTAEKYLGLFSLPMILSTDLTGLN